MRILAQQELPDDENRYFAFYHRRTKFKPTTDDLRAIHEELELALKKYRSKNRISAIIKVIRIALKITNWNNQDQNSAVREVASALL